MYVEYACRRSGKTNRLCKDLIVHLLLDDKHKAYVFSKNRYTEHLIKSYLPLNKDMFYRIQFFSDNIFNFFEQSILIRCAFNDPNVKFYFDDFEDLVNSYDMIKDMFLEAEMIHDRMYLTSSPTTSMLSYNQEIRLKEIRKFLKNKDNLNILTVGFFDKEKTI